MLPHLHEDEAGNDGVAPQRVVGGHLASCQLTRVALSLRRKRGQRSFLRGPRSAGSSLVPHWFINWLKSGSALVPS